MTGKPALATRVGAYLNQDVFDFYPDELAAIDDFIQSEPEGVATLRAELAEILATRSDEEIDALVTNHGIGFIPGELGYRGWLVTIAERVRAASAT